MPLKKSGQANDDAMKYKCLSTKICISQSFLFLLPPFHLHICTSHFVCTFAANGK